MDTIEGNKLIAEFIGNSVDVESYNAPLISEPNGNYYYLHEAKYHSSWDWLMPVVKRIADDEELLIDFKVSDYHPFFEKIKTALSFVSISGVWESVVEFIEWFNSVRNVQASVATEDDSSNAADQQK